MARTSAWFAGLLAVCLILASCAAPNRGAHSPGTDQSRPVAGGDLTYLDYQAPYAFNLGNNSYWQNQGIVTNVLDRLVFVDPDGRGLHPWIAQSWNVSPDGLTYTFDIRRGVTYSDGTAVDAENVKKNLEVQSFGDGHGNVKNPYFPKVKAITADSATQQVVLTLEQPYPYFLNQLAYVTAGLASSRYFDLSFDDQGAGRNLIGSGPYVIEASSSKQTRLIQRQGYAWAPAGVTNQGEAYLNSITIIPVQENSVRLGSVISHQADLLHYIEPSSESAAHEKGLQVLVQSYPDQTSYLLVLRSGAPNLGNQDVRRALVLGVDRRQLVDVVYSSSYKPATGLYNAQSPDFVPQPEAVKFDPVAAGALLDNAGWRIPPGGDGIRVDASGRRLVLKALIDVYTVGAPAAFEFVQVALRRIGVDLQLKRVDYSDYPTAAKDTDIGLIYSGGSHEAAYAMARNALKAGADIFKLNGSDTTLERLSHAVIYDNSTGPAHDTILHDFQDYLIKSGYILPLTERTQTYAAGADVHGFTQTQSSPWFYLTWKG